MKTISCLFIFYAFFTTSIFSQSCDNRTLHFDGIDDVVIANTPPVNGAGDFSVETWFTISAGLSGSCNATASKRYLLSLSGTNDYLEVRTCGNQLEILVLSLIHI